VAFWNRKKSEAELSLERLQSGGAGAQGAQPVESAEPVAAAAAGPFSLTIEDVFAITGRGTVVTGRVSSGVVRVGMPATVTSAAGPIATTVTAIEQFRKKADQAAEGDNVGLMLDGVTRYDVARGDVVSGTA
jgi:translation elongation factor EF-Tu-like GTPase